MRRLRKALGRILLTVLLLVLSVLLAVGVVLGWQGHTLYKEAVETAPIGSMYDRIRARGEFVTFDQLPGTYVDAVISVEDRRFAVHHGIDPISIGRALVIDVKTHSLAEGGSTLTQQLAKNELFTQEKRMARKAAEMFAALDIEKNYSKQQIFEMYANTIYFGSGYYGIAQAAQGYFGKTPAQLTDAEAVVLAGLPNAPSLYSPKGNPALALKRTKVVLDRMTEAKKLTPAEADVLEAEITALPVMAQP